MLMHSIVDATLYIKYYGIFFRPLLLNYHFEIASMVCQIEESVFMFIHFKLLMLYTFMNHEEVFGIYLCTLALGIEQRNTQTLKHSIDSCIFFIPGGFAKEFTQNKNCY